MLSKSIPTSITNQCKHFIRKSSATNIDIIKIGTEKGSHNHDKSIKSVCFQKIHFSRSCAWVVAFPDLSFLRFWSKVRWVVFQWYPFNYSKTCKKYEENILFFQKSSNMNKTTSILYDINNISINHTWLFSLNNPFNNTWCLSLYYNTKTHELWPFRIYYFWDLGIKLYPFNFPPIL